MANINLSQCLVVKNNAKNIRKALSWGKDVVFEQIVVDLGSEDDSVKIAESMGAIVYHFDWNGIDMAARNFAIGKATGDWIVFLNADEYFSEEDGQKLLQLIEKIENQGTQTVQFIQAIRCSWVFLDKKNMPHHVQSRDQVFRKSATGILEYQGVLAESAVASVWDAQKELCIFCKEGSQNGYGYEASVQNQQFIHKNESKENLIHIYQELISMACIKNVQQSEEEYVLVLYDKALEVSNCFPDYDFYVGYWMMKRSMWKGAIEFLERAIEKTLSWKGAVTSETLKNTPQIYFWLAGVAQKIQDAKRVVKYSVIILKLDAYKADVLYALIKQFSFGLNPVMAEDIFIFLSKIYNFARLEDKLFVLKCVKMADNKKLIAVMANFFNKENNE